MYSMNNILIKAINDFNKFKHDDEHIYTYKTYEGKWLQKGGFLVITSDYEEDDYDKCHIHYKNKFFGSEKFNQWLRNYDFEFEFFDNKHGYIFLKMTFD